MAQMHEPYKSPIKNRTYLINSLSCTYKSSQEAFNCWCSHFKFQKIQDSRFHLQNLHEMICFRFASFKWYNQNKYLTKEFNTNLILEVCVISYITKFLHLRCTNLLIFTAKNNKNEFLLLHA
jgi:hypothetical protein